MPPQGLYFIQHPETFVERAADVSVFNPMLNEGNVASTFLDNAARVLGMFNFSGDQASDRNIPGQPIFDPVSSTLMVMGLIFTLRRIREPRYAFLVLWLFIMLLPNLMAVKDAPDYLRVTGLIPALFVLPALSTAWLWNWWEKRGPTALRPLAVWAVLFAYCAGFAVTYHNYFEIWANLPQRDVTFNNRSYSAVGMAIALEKEGKSPMVLGAGNADGVVQRYALADQKKPVQLQLFDDTRSIIFPPSNSQDYYIFPDENEIPNDLLSRYFDVVSTTTPPWESAEPARIFRPKLPLPNFQPEVAVSATFGDSVEVIGYDLPKAVNAGDSMTVRWYWRIIKADDRDYGFANKVFNEEHELISEESDRGFSPGYWPEGTIGISTFELPIDAAAETGGYELQTEVLDRTTWLALPLKDGQGRQVGQTVTVGTFKVSGQQHIITNPQADHRVLMSDGISLSGYDLVPNAKGPEPGLDLTLYWNIYARPSQNYTVFVHVLDSRGNSMAQADAPPRQGHYPSSLWDEGEVIVDPHHIPVDPALLKADYQIEIGLYEPETGRRLPIVDEAGNTLGDHVTIQGERP